MKKSERKLFDEYIGRWRQYAGPSDEGAIRELVASLYEDLELDCPEIVMCRGQLQQAIFPSLVFFMLRQGKERTANSAFKRLSAFANAGEIHDAWNDLWLEAYDCLEWKQAASCPAGTGLLLHRRLLAHIDKTVRIQAIAQIDQEIGFERHQRWEAALTERLHWLYSRIRFALLQQYINMEGVWRSFVGRLPKNFLAELLPIKRQNFGDSLSSSKRPQMNDWMGGWDWIALATCDFAREYLNCSFSKEVDQRLNRLMSIAFGATAYLFYEHCCFVYLKPLKLFLDEGARPHNSDDAAIEFADGTELFIWHGWEVSPKIIKDPKSIRIGEIERERNVEVRRIMIERYGLDSFLRDSAARTIHKDAFGRLYRKEIPGDEPLVVVRVENSTPEPDGSYKNYFLRVPPRITTARAAVAWTFGLEPSEYSPKKQT